jgi:hypothetical protein
MISAGPAASGMAGSASSFRVIEKILNHTSGSFRGIVVRVYQRHSIATRTPSPPSMGELRAIQL